MHTVGIQLEDAQGMPRRQEFICSLIINGDLGNINMAFAVCLNIVEGLLDHCQVGQPQEIHFYKPEGLACMVFESRCDSTVSTPEQRRGICDRLRCHNGSACVHACLADQPFNTFCFLRNFLHIRIPVVQVAEFLGFCIAFGFRVENIMKADILAAHSPGQRFCNRFTHLEFIIKDAGGIFKRLLGFDSPVCYALGNFIGAIFPGDILQDFIAACRVEIHIDIREGYTLRVQEALKNKAMLKRIQLCDAHRIGDHAPCSRASSRTYHNTVGFGPVDIISHNKEVAAELHLADHAAFIISLFRHFFRDAVRIALLQALLNITQKQRCSIPSFRTVKFGHISAVFMVVEHDIAPLCDLNSVIACTGKILEKPAHLFSRFNVVPAAVKMEPVGVSQP